MHWLAALIILAQFAMQLAPQPLASSLVTGAMDSPVITSPKPDYTFGQQIAFEATVQPGTNVREVLLNVASEGQDKLQKKMDLAVEERSTDAASSVLATANVDVRQDKIILQPFARVNYYFQVKLKDGSEAKSETFQFSYNDNRFTWQTAEDSAFQAHWNGSDTGLGQVILSVAQDGLRQAEDIMNDTPREPIRIYAYSSSNDLRSALNMTNRPYVAGHALPEMGLIMISVPSGPERKLELERQIPHEIMHILQYQAMGDQYTRQPVWLVEGMASMVELTQNPEYRRVLDTTAQERKLLPISSLCVSFPGDASGAYLAYAESDSFVRFLHQKYGSSGLRALITQYRNGLGCEEGVSAALGVSLRQIENRWQQEALGMNAGALVLQNLSPYLLLGLVLLIVPAITFLLPYRAHKPASQGTAHE